MLKMWNTANAWKGNVDIVLVIRFKVCEYEEARASLSLLQIGIQKPKGHHVLPLLSTFGSLSTSCPCQLFFLYIGIPHCLPFRSGVVTCATKNLTQSCSSTKNRHDIFFSFVGTWLRGVPLGVSHLATRLEHRPWHNLSTKHARLYGNASSQGTWQHRELLKNGGPSQKTSSCTGTFPTVSGLLTASMS